MVLDDKGTDQEPRASRPSDSGAEVASPAEDRSTFIGLGTTHEGMLEPPSAEHRDAESSVSSEGADSDEDRAKAPPPSPSLESNAVRLEDATSPLEPASKDEPAAVAEIEPASDRAEARNAGPNMPDTEESAARAAQGSRESEIAERGSPAVDDAAPAPTPVTPRKTSHGALLFALASVVLVGGWWMVNRESSPTEESGSPTMQQDPVPPNVESTLPAEPRAAERAAQEQAQPMPQSQSQPSLPSDDRGAQISTKMAAEVPSPVPAANAPVDNTAGKAASSQLTPRRAALVAIAKETEMRHCRRKPDPIGTAQAMVTFDSSGRVSNARVLSPYAATHTGVCLTERLKQITMEPFSGESLTVQAAIELY